MPYLDSRAQAIFERPLDVALRLEDVGIDPPRRDATAREKRGLFHRLDESDCLGLVAESRIFPGYQAGLCSSIMKDLSTDRLIVDSRPGSRSLVLATRFF